MTRTGSWRPLRLCVSALFVSALVRAESPGTHYPSGGTRPGVSPQASAGTNAPYARTITIYGSVNTNDLLRFLDRTGSRVAGTNVLSALDYYGTNWQARVDALTNGAALGATAMQPAATNGWTVGSHAGLATWPGATNAAFAAWATAAATGTVAYATEATRIAVPGDADYWLSVCGGTGALWRVEVTGVVTTVVVTARDDQGAENGTPPAIGHVFFYKTTIMGSTEVWYTNSWGDVFIGADTYPNAYGGGVAWTARLVGMPAALAATEVDNPSNFEIAYSIRNILSTNSYTLATLVDVAALPTFPALNASNAADRAYATNAMAIHNTNGLAHADIRGAIDAIPLPPTNAVAGWLVWDAGSNCYWRISATNLRFYVWGVAE